MIHDTIAFCRALLLAWAVGVLTAGASPAAPAAQGGGAHGGGVHGGGFHGGFHNGFLPTFHANVRPFRQAPFNSYRGFRSFPSSPGYGYPRSYYGSIFPPFYYGGGVRYPDDSSDQPSGGAVPRKLAPDYTAHVTVKVPAGAELWFDEKKKKSTGPVRVFVTPKLTPDQEYTYEVRARWQEKGHEVTQTREAVVTAGADVEVDFTAAEPPKPR